jgi:hypothetical protein
MTSRAQVAELTAIVRMGDDEERIGHVLRRIVPHLRSLEIPFELVAVDEGSGDNSVFVATMLKSELPEIEVRHAQPGAGFHDAAQEAYGRLVLLYDARCDAPLNALGYAIGRLREGLDVVAVGGRYLVLRRARAWRAFDALIEGRDTVELERRVLKRSRALGLECEVTHPTASTWRKLGQTLGLTRFV